MDIIFDVMEPPPNFDWTVMLNEYWICKLGARTCSYTYGCLHYAGVKLTRN